MTKTVLTIVPMTITKSAILLSVLYTLGHNNRKCEVCLLLKCCNGCTANQLVALTTPATALILSPLLNGLPLYAVPNWPVSLSLF